jgi:hypothetical protein
MYGQEKKCIQGFGWVTCRYRLEDNIKMDVKGTGWENAE